MKRMTGAVEKLAMEGEPWACQVSKWMDKIKRIKTDWGAGRLAEEILYTAIEARLLGRKEGLALANRGAGRKS